MTEIPQWWARPRRITVVVDNPSWVIPYANQLITKLREEGDEVEFAGDYDEVMRGGIAFYLGCVRITPPDVLARNRRNMVVHASDLPRGRGFSPLSWQIIEGINRIPICLLDAVEEVDAGPVIYREWIEFEGHELLDELRHAVGQATVDLCRRFLNEVEPVAGQVQEGGPTRYARRRPRDSELDPTRSIADQFDLLRTVSNDDYPAWFEFRGRQYKIAISKINREKSRDDDVA